MMMPAGIDAAGDVDVQLPEIAGKVEIAEATRQFLGDRYGAGIGKTAIIEARTGDDVGDEADIGGGDPDGVERAPQRRQVALRHMGQHQVLLVADPDFAERIALGEIRDGIHLVGGGVAGRSALGLEREGDDRMARHLVVCDRIAEPGIEAPVGRAARKRVPADCRSRRGIVRIAEARSRRRRPPPDRGRADHP